MLPHPELQPRAAGGYICSEGQIRASTCYPIFKLAAPPECAPGPSPAPRQERSPDLQVQDHLSPVVLAGVRLDPVDPGALEERPGLGQQRARGRDGSCPAQHRVLSTIINMTSALRRHQHRNPPMVPSALVTLVLPSLECAPLFLSPPQTFTEHHAAPGAGLGEGEKPGAGPVRTAHSPAEEMVGREGRCRLCCHVGIWGRQEHLLTQRGVGRGQ